MANQHSLSQLRRSSRLILFVVYAFPILILILIVNLNNCEIVEYIALLLPWRTVWNHTFSGELCFTYLSLETVYYPSFDNKIIFQN